MFNCLANFANVYHRRFYQKCFPSCLKCRSNYVPAKSISVFIHYIYTRFKSTLLSVNRTRKTVHGNKIKWKIKSKQQQF